MRLSLTTEALAELTSAHQPPALSLYQPTHRRHPENQQDPIRFRNLLKGLETSLREQHPEVETRPLLEPFEALAHDHDFWKHTLDGLAVLGGPGLFRVFQLQRPVTALAVVADTFLMEASLNFNPEGLPIDELRARAWEVVEPQYQARLAALGNEFAVAKANGLGSGDLAEVARAAAAGRVGTLLIEADRRMPGRLDTATGRVEAGDPSHPQVDDLFDDLSELVEKMGGLVLVLPAEGMPEGTGLAATYRH